MGVDIKKDALRLYFARLLNHMFLLMLLFFVCAVIVFPQIQGNNI